MSFAATRLPRSVFLFLSMLMLALAAAACGGGGGGGGEEPPAITVPTVISTTPVDGADGVPSGVDVIINFSEAMDTTSVVTGLDVASHSGSTTAVWSVGNTRVTLSFDPQLEDDTHYVVTLDASVLDAEGTSMGAAYGFSFTTGSVPLAAIVSPSPGATSVGTDPIVSISFSESMDTASVPDNFSVLGYDGALTFIWGNNGNGAASSVDIYFDTSLGADTTYTATLLLFAEDAQGTPLGVSKTVTFSTGSTVASGSISGVIDDDPDSNYDNDLGSTIAALFDHNFMDTGGAEPVIASVDASGAYHFSFLEDGDYWVLAIQDTNGDGELGGDKFAEKGDSVGLYSDVASQTFTTITVSGGPESASFTLLDTEGISGEVTYAGSSTSQAYASSTTVFAGAFVSSDLSGDPEYGATSSTDNEEDFNSETKTWNYAINAFFGDPGGVRMNTASYFIGAFLDLNNNSQFDPDLNGDGDYDDGEPAGVFSSAVPILDTGHDAVGIDITAYDTITIFGNLSVATLGSVEPPYEGAVISLLDYPVTASTDASGDFFMSFVPIGMELAVHAEPDSSDSLMPFNTQYMEVGPANAYLGSSDPGGEGVRGVFIGDSVLQQVAALCGVTVDSSLAQIVGNSNVVGGEVIFGSNDVYYTDSNMNCSHTSIQADGDPSFLIFNVDADDYISSGNKASIRASGGTTVTATIPVRQGEFTWVELNELN